MMKRFGPRLLGLALLWSLLWSAGLFAAEKSAKGTKKTDETREATSDKPNQDVTAKEDRDSDAEGSADWLRRDGMGIIFRPNVILKTLPWEEIVRKSGWKHYFGPQLAGFSFSFLRGDDSEGAWLGPLIQLIREKTGTTLEEADSPFAFLPVLAEHIDLYLLFVDDFGLVSSPDPLSPGEESRTGVMVEPTRRLRLFVVDRPVLTDPEIRQLIAGESVGGRLVSGENNLFAFGFGDKTFIGEEKIAGTSKYVLVQGNNREQVVSILNQEKTAPILPGYFSDQDRTLFRILFNNGVIQRFVYLIYFSLIRQELIESRAKTAANSEDNSPAETGVQNEAPEKFGVPILSREEMIETVSRRLDFLKTIRSFDYRLGLNEEKRFVFTIDAETDLPEEAENYKNIACGLLSFMKVRLSKNDRTRELGVMLQNVKMESAGTRLSAEWSLPQAFVIETGLRTLDRFDETDETAEKTGKSESSPESTETIPSETKAEESAAEGGQAQHEGE